MRRLLVVLGVVVFVGIPRAGAQVPPLPLPTSTTTTAAPEPSTTIPPDETTDVPTTETPTTVVDTAPAQVPPTLPVTVVPSTSTTAPARTIVTVPDKEAAIASAFSGSFGIAVAILLVVALLLVALSSRANPGGFRMNDPRRRWRLIAGVASLALAAIVGLIGWLEVSDEPHVNRQIPYLTSAGMVLVVLATIGGSLLVAEQLRTDDRRIEELESAVERLSQTLAPLIESPPRP